MPLRIIFCGTPEFALPSLQALHNDPSFEILQIITQPDKPAGRGKKLTSPPIKELAQSLGIAVSQPENINRFQVSGVSFQDCDFLVVVAYGQILSKEILALPKIASVNIHASLLPRWRGASPIASSILAGDTETGITIQRMVEKLDAGPILAQERVMIRPRETKASLSQTLAILGAKLLVQTLKAPLQEIVQKESEATYCKKLTREMGTVDPNIMTAEEIDRHVRALIPWPGVSVDVGSVMLSGASGSERRRSMQQVKLIETSLEPHPDALEIPCAKQTSLFVLKLQEPTKRVVTGREWKKL
jgi:methionyl-tRNA formyltransferase